MTDKTAMLLELFVAVIADRMMMDKTFQERVTSLVENVDIESMINRAVANEVDNRVETAINELGDRKEEKLENLIERKIKEYCKEELEADDITGFDDAVESAVEQILDNKVEVTLTVRN